MGELPTGTVTFLLTDVEGSTKLWQAHDDVMNDVLSRHDELIAKAVADHSGVLLKSKGEGDSTFSVFTRPTDALAAAIDAQRLLAAEPWPGQIEAKVRMAVHTGEAELRDGDYYGTTVNRCARVRAVAHGEQVLVTQATTDLALDSLGGGAALVDLGTHRLKDLERPERLYQLAHPEIRSEFPPLRSLDTSRNNLPAQRTSFIGRHDEIALVRKLLVSNRLVTLTGVGGCGKTRLSLQVAAEEIDNFTDGVVFVELAPVSDPDVVAEVVASAVVVTQPALTTGTSQSARELLLAFLSERTMLLITDNCEHLVEAAADLIDDVLSLCPNVKVLATSREALELEGEQTYSVPSLDVPTEDVASASSARLFEDRAAGVRPGFAITAENASAIGEICRRLDGIPLAIELAASQAAHLSPHQIADRLNDRFRLLTGGRRRVQRQQTLSAALDWSHDLLSGDEQTVLRRLAVFPGDFTLDAAEVVCDVTSFVTTLRSLVAKSLVVTEQSEDDLRYRMLETVRLYAEEKLVAAGEADEFRSRHRDHLLVWLEAFPETSFLEVEWGLAIGREAHNIRSSLEWSAQEGRTDVVVRLAIGALPLWASKTPDEGARWLAWCIDREQDVPHALLLPLYSAASWLANIRLSDDIFPFASRAVAVAEDEPSIWLQIALSGQTLFWSFWAGLGDEESFARMREAGERSLAFARRSNDLYQLSGALLSLGMAMAGAGRYEESLPLLDETVEASTRPGSVMMHACMASSRMTYVLHLLGRHEDALASAHRSEALLARFFDRRWTDEGWSLVNRFGTALALWCVDRREEARSQMQALAQGAPRCATAGTLGELFVVLSAMAVWNRDNERASRLLATAGRENVARSPVTFRMHHHYVRQVRAALSPEVARRCRDEGFLMPTDEAIAYGLEGLR